MLLFHVVSSSLAASQLSIKISKPETLAMVLTANDRGPHSCRVHGQLEAWMLIGWRLVHFYGAGVRHFLNKSAATNCLKHVWNILKRQFILFVAFLFRHFPLSVQLWLPRHLVQELAEQLDHEGDSWQLTFFEADVPSSDSQLPRFLDCTEF